MSPTSRWHPTRATSWAEWSQAEAGLLGQRDEGSDRATLPTTPGVAGKAPANTKAAVGPLLEPTAALSATFSGDPYSFTTSWASWTPARIPAPR